MASSQNFYWTLEVQVDSRQSILHFESNRKRTIKNILRRAMIEAGPKSYTDSEVKFIGKLLAKLTFRGWRLTEDDLLVTKSEEVTNYQLE